MPGQDPGLARAREPSERHTEGGINTFVRYAVAACLIGYVLIGLATLTELPLVWEDEPWYTQSAWSFAQQGTFALPMFADLAGFDRDNVVYGRTYLASVAAIYEVAGVSPFTARLASFISGLVAIAAVYGIGRELWGHRVGLVAAGLLAIAPNFVRQTHDARPEIMLVAAWTSALYLLLSGEARRSRWRLVAAGLLAALAGDVHLNGLIVAPALFVVLLVQRSEPRTLVTYVAGVLLGAAWWLWVHVVQDPQLFIDQLSLYSRGWPISEVLADPIVVFGAEVARYLLVEPRGAVILLVFAVIATAVLIAKRPDRALLSLLAFTLGVFAFMALFSGVRSPIYAVLLWPIAALILARHLDIAPRPLALVTALLVCAASIVSVVLLAAELWPADYDRYIAKLRDVIPEGASMQAHPTVWFGFMDQPFIATHHFMWAGPYEDEVRRLGIEYVIADEFEVLDGCSSCRATMPDEVRAFLADHASLVAEVEDPHYGRVRTEDGPGYVSRVYRVLDPR